jgi:hypothetical protein
MPETEDPGACGVPRAPGTRLPARPADVPVPVLSWPDEREDARRLAASDLPLLLVVAADAPPPTLVGCLVDWVRAPATETDVRARVLTLAERALQHPPHPHPHLDEFGCLSYGGRNVYLSPLDELVARALVESFGHAVAEERLLRSDEPGGAVERDRLRLAVTRLRRKIGPLGLGVTAMRGFGYYLHDLDRP